MNAKYRFGGVTPLISLLLILAFLSIGIGTAAAASPIVSIAVSNTDVCVGESFDVFITVDPNGNSLQTAQVDLGYDSSKVSLTVEDGTMFGMFGPGTSGAGTVNDITGVGSGVTTPGNLAVLHVTATAAGTVNLDLSGVTTNTATDSLTPIVNDEILSITVCGGSPDPNAPIVEILPTPKSVCVDDTFDINIAVDPNGNSLQTTQVDLGYDSSKVSLTVGDGTMFGMFGPGTSGVGTVNDITGVGSGVTTPGNLAVLHVTANAIGTVNLDLSGVIAATSTDSLTPTVNDGVIEIDGCTGPFQPPTPQPRITAPEDGATINGTVEVTEVDDSGSTNITYNLFEYCADTGGSCAGAWTEIGNDTDGAPWSATWNTKLVMNGDYLIRATMGDTTNGLVGTDEISVMVNNAMPENNIPLYNMWNYISFPGTLDNATPEHVLENLSIDVVLHYNADSEIWENAATFVEFKPRTAYAIRVSVPQTIVNLDYKPDIPPTLQLYEGWNSVGLIGNAPGTQTNNAEAAFALIDDNYDRLVGPWVSTSGGYYSQNGFNENVYGPTPPGSINTDSVGYVLNRYEGHWINMTSADLLS
ncbi:MAG: hypothetical protein KAH86_00210 [Methanosarcinales archaeon]|nr:hypothetical protein [Methanosarcinales archaeon]